MPETIKTVIKKIPIIEEDWKKLISYANEISKNGLPIKPHTLAMLLIRGGLNGGTYTDKIRDILLSMGKIKSV